VTKFHKVQGSTLTFGDTRIFLQHSGSTAQVEESVRAEKRLDLFSRFDAILACDRQIDGRTDRQYCHHPLCLCLLF